MKTQNLTTLRGLALLLSLLLMLATAGCIFSPDEGDGPGGDTDDVLVYPNTEDKVLENFVIIYTDMLFDDFRDMLHVDYKTILLEDTINDWDLPANSVFDRDLEILIHDNMFGGNPGRGSNGNEIPPLASIEVDLFDRMTPWADVPQDDVNFPGARMAKYTVKILFHDNSGTHAFSVIQEVDFFVVPVDDGGRTKFLLRGQLGYPIAE